MEKNIESQGAVARRRLSQIKVLSRLLEHELELAKGEEVVLDKDLMENTLDVLELFIEEAEGASGLRQSGRERKVVQAGEGKAQVTRLN